MDSLNFSSFNIVDYILVAILFLSILIGFARGLISELISLLTLVAAIVVAIAFTNPLAAYITSTAVVQDAVNHTTSAVGTSTATPISYMTLCISFAFLFIATLIIGAFIKMLLNMIFQHGLLGIGNRLLGGVFGLVRGFLITLVIIFLMQLTRFAHESWWVQSQLVPYYQPQVIWLGNIVSPALENLKATFGSSVEDAKDAVNHLMN